MATTERFEKIEDRLASLADANDGRLTADLVVKDAEDDTSPLHKYFEWDDKKAAHQHRLDTARALIRSVEIKITVFKKEAKVPAYVRDPEAAQREQGYVATASIKTDVQFRKEALAMELRRSGWTLERARSLATFFGLDDQVTHLVSGVSEVESALNEIS